jgi:hypothetical protein
MGPQAGEPGSECVVLNCGGNLNAARICERCALRAFPPNARKLEGCATFDTIEDLTR